MQNNQINTQNEKKYFLKISQSKISFLFVFIFLLVAVVCIFFIGWASYDIYQRFTYKTVISINEDSSTNITLNENGMELSKAIDSQPEEDDFLFLKSIIIKNPSKINDTFHKKMPDTLYVLDFNQNNKIIAKIETNIRPGIERNLINAYSLADEKIYLFNYSEKMTEQINFNGLSSLLNFTEVKSPIYSEDFLISPDNTKIAWVETNSQYSDINSQFEMISKIWIADIDGTNKKILLEKNFVYEQYFKLIKWSNLSNQIYFSSQTGGLGGYFLFECYHSLSKINPENNDLEIIFEEMGEDRPLCIQDVSSDEKLISSIGMGTSPRLIIKNLETSEDVTFPIPTEEGFRTGGNAFFSPNNNLIAYNIARQDSDQERYKTIIVDYAEKKQRTIIDDPYKIYLVNQWVSKNKILITDLDYNYYLVSTDNLKIEKIEVE